MLNGFFWAMLILAVTDWLATWRCWRRVRWVTKPGALILLIAWFTQVGGWRGPLVWFGLGLVFALLGDILLLLRERFFLLGLAAFLLTHIFYIIGFTRQPLVLRWDLVIPFLVIGAIFLALTRSIRAGLQRRGETGLVVPVMGYAVILSLMWLSALTSLMRPGWTEPPGMIVSLGAGLFFLSDALLAYNRFVRAVPRGDFLVMVAYHLGQILLAFGVLLQYP